MKKFLTMAFVFTLASTTGVLGANDFNNCEAVTTYKVFQTDLNNNCTNISDEILNSVCNKPVILPEQGKDNECDNSFNTDKKDDNIQNDSNNQENNQNSQILDIEREVVNLVNQERANYGLSALEIDFDLTNIARLKSQDMANLNYFSHTSPTYGSPFDMLSKFNINYRSAGENIAKGQKTAEEVVNAWMNSEGHRANILNSSYTHIGVGYVLSGNTPYWTQMFLSK